MNKVPVILVCGSRDLGFQSTKITEEQKKEYRFVCRSIDSVIEEKNWITEPDSYGNYLPRFHMVHGNAHGVDACANDYSISNWVPCTPYPANWSRYGKKAGFLRNKEMLEKGKPDLVIAIFRSKENPSKGTSMMVRLAKAKGIEVREFYYE